MAILKRIVFSLSTFILPFILASFVLADEFEISNIHLQKGVQLYKSADFKGALEELKKAEDEISAENKGERLELFKYLGFIYVGLKKKEEAIGEFKKALSIDPAIKLDLMLISPSILKVFKEAKAQIDSDPPEIIHEPIKSVNEGEKIEDTFRVNDISEVKEVKLHHRKAGDGIYTSVDLKKTGDNLYQLSLPALYTYGRNIEYYLEAYDEFGNGPALNGKSDSPHVIIIVPAKKIRPKKVFLKKRAFWKWTTLGISIGGVLGAGAYGYMAKNDYDEYNSTNDPINARKLHDSTLDKAMIGAINVAVGIIAGGFSTYLFITDRGSESEKRGIGETGKGRMGEWAKRGNREARKWRVGEASSPPEMWGFVVLPYYDSGVIWGVKMSFGL